MEKKRNNLCCTKMTCFLTAIITTTTATTTTTWHFESNANCSRLTRPASCGLDSASSSRSQFSLHFYLMFNHEGQFPISMKINRSKKGIRLRGNTRVRSFWHLENQKASIAPPLLCKMSLKSPFSYHLSTTFSSVVCLDDWDTQQKHHR